MTGNMKDNKAEINNKRPQSCFESQISLEALKVGEGQGDIWMQKSQHQGCLDDNQRCKILGNLASKLQ